MKLTLTGHSYKYAVEQIMTVLFPGEKPDYGQWDRREENCAAVELSEGLVWVSHHPAQPERNARHRRQPRPALCPGNR